MGLFLIGYKWIYNILAKKQPLLLMKTNNEYFIG